MPDQDQMCQFYDVMVACGMNVPPIEAWLAHYSVETEFWPLTDDRGAVYGGVLFKNHMVHLAIHPKLHRRWITPRILKAYWTWRPACDVFATPHRDNRTAIEFARRLGFQDAGTRGEFVILKKEAACHPH